MNDPDKELIDLFVNKLGRDMESNKWIFFAELNKSKVTK